MLRITACFKVWFLWFRNKFKITTYLSQDTCTVRMMHKLILLIGDKTGSVDHSEIHRLKCHCGIQRLCCWRSDLTVEAGVCYFQRGKPVPSKTSGLLL